MFYVVCLCFYGCLGLRGVSIMMRVVGVCVEFSGFLLYVGGNVCTVVVFIICFKFAELLGVTCLIRWTWFLV